MIDAAPSLQAAKGISGSDLLSYLEAEGWTATPSKVEGIMILSREIPGADQRAEFIVPAKAGFNDEVRRVADALRTVSQIEGCPEAWIAEKVVQFADRKRAASEDPHRDRRRRGRQLGNEVAEEQAAADFTPPKP
jgi:hypothetical protein